MSLGITLAALGFAFSASSIGALNVYCGWTRGVLKLNFSDDLGLVDLKSSLGTVPTPGRYETKQVNRQPFGSGLSFTITENGFVYEMTFSGIGKSYGPLLEYRNTELETGEQSTGRNYCYLEAGK